ncbi:hypothetical protein IWX85_000529 [Polaromonas sp. CG_9.11]|nr:hypothetical protein [Polaromonas sp. CG_9.11]
MRQVLGHANGYRACKHQCFHRCITFSTQERQTVTAIVYPVPRAASLMTSFSACRGKGVSRSLHSTSANSFIPASFASRCTALPSLRFTFPKKPSAYSVIARATWPQVRMTPSPAGEGWDKGQRAWDQPQKIPFGEPSPQPSPRGRGSKRELHSSSSQVTKPKQKPTKFLQSINQEDSNWSGALPL